MIVLRMASQGVLITSAEGIPCEASAASDGMGSFDCVGVRFANANFAQDDKL